MDKVVDKKIVRYILDTIMLGSGGNYNPGSDVLVQSSLPGVYCGGPCRQHSGNKTQCPLVEGGKDMLYCSKALSLERKQISSHNRLWCTGPCIKNQGDDYYKCRYNIQGME